MNRGVVVGLVIPDGAELAVSVNRQTVLVRLRCFVVDEPEAAVPDIYAEQPAVPEIAAVAVYLVLDEVIEILGIGELSFGGKSFQIAICFGLVFRQLFQSDIGFLFGHRHSDLIGVGAAVIEIPVYARQRGQIAADSF